MKICFLHMTMGMVNRGSEVSTHLIATELAKKNDVLVIQSGITTNNAYQSKQVYPQESIPVTSPSNFFEKIMFRLHLDNGSGRIAEFTKLAVGAINKFNPDVVIAVNGSVQIKVLVSLGVKCPIVVFGRAGIGYHDRDTLRSKPNLFIALSETALVWAKSYATSKTKVVYIPNPVQLDKLKKTNLNLTKPVVLTVAALSKYKNVDKVIEAVSMTNSSLLLIGDGEESESISRALAKLPNEFRWIKGVDPLEISSYYAAADIFCFVPDSQEAFGRVYLEAMAAGLPIIATDDAIRRSIVGQSGYYVSPKDVEGIATLIVKNALIDRIDYHSQLKKYDLKTVVSQIEKELHDIL